VGLSEKLYELRSALLRTAREHVASCGCESGCPSCVGPHNEVAGNPKRAALTMLDRLTTFSDAATVGAAPATVVPFRSSRREPRGVVLD
jgi:ATP-dependent helicase YprA (DUF1998 family)